MSEELKKAGLYIDDVYSLRVLDPKISTETTELKEECNEYSEKLADFKKIADELIAIADNFATEVEKQKMKALNAQNLLKSVSKEREDESQYYQSQIMEKTMELERLKTEYQYLQRIESEQQEIINNILENQ